MSENKASTAVLILHVNMQYEAESAVETLKESKIPAYYSPTPTGDALGLPGALGINDAGYDVFVTEDDIKDASAVLAGIGYISLYEDPDSELEEDTPETSASEGQLTDREKRERLQQSIDELSKGKRLWYSVCLAFFALVGLGVFVWLCDLVIAFVLNLFK